jgi:hypothetical protein
MPSVSTPGLDISTSVICYVDSTASVTLLERVATEEAEQLDDYAFECVRRCPSFCCVQNGSTDKIAVHIGMDDPALYCDGWCEQWIILAKFDSQMQRVLILGRENEARFPYVCIVKVQVHVWVGILLNPAMSLKSRRSRAPGPTVLRGDGIIVNDKGVMRGAEAPNQERVTRFRSETGFYTNAATMS